MIIKLLRGADTFSPFKGTPSIIEYWCCYGQVAYPYGMTIDFSTEIATPIPYHDTSGGIYFKWSGSGTDNIVCKKACNVIEFGYGDNITSKYSCTVGQTLSKHNLTILVAYE